MKKKPIKLSMLSMEQSKESASPKRIEKPRWPTARPPLRSRREENKNANQHFTDDSDPDKSDLSDNPISDDEEITEKSTFDEEQQPTNRSAELDGSITENSYSNHKKGPQRDDKNLPTTPVGKSYIPVIYGVIFLLIAISAIKLLNRNVKVDEQKDAYKRCNEFIKLEKHFPAQDNDLWYSLKIGVESVMNGAPPTPSVFLIVYNDTNDSIEILDRIVNITTNCMNIGRSAKPLRLKTAVFQSKEMIEDYGRVIELVRPELQQTGVLFVPEIGAIPGQTAEAFHSICDNITPLVKRSVIFLGLRIDQELPVELLNFVETWLRNIWKSIDRNSLEALIARVTDQVFLLKS